MKVAVTGSSGLVGTALTASLRADGHQVVRLVRRPPRAGGAGDANASAASDEATSEVRWDPRAADAGNPPLSGVDAVVHLAGAGVGDHRWTASYKAEIRASRVLATAALATAFANSALAGTRPRPKTFIAASAIGWYGDTGGGEVTEDAPAGTGFLSRVVHDWEAAADPARGAGVRVAHLRSGLVLGAGGGVLARLALPARLGVLPRFGDGHQVMSWISLTDEIRAIRFLLDGPGAESRSGPYNLTAPNAVTNGELTAALHAAFRRPDFPWLRVPAPLLKLALGEMSSELLTSARVLPARLLESGFEFSYPVVGAALAAELPRLGTRLHDDVEVGVAERDLNSPSPRQGLVRDLFEVDHQGLLHREYRVGLDVLAARHEDVRGQVAVAGGRHDEVDVRRAERVPARRQEQLANRAVGRDRVVAWHDRAERELAVLIGREQSAAVRAGLHGGLLYVIEALFVGLPHVEGGAGQRGAAHRDDPAGDHARRSGAHQVDVVAKRADWRLHHVERAEHRRLGRDAELPVRDGLDQHRQPENVRQQDELLPLVVALVPGPGEEVDRLLPLGDRQLNVAGERVQVPHQRGQDLAQPRAGIRREGLDDCVSRGFLGEIGSHGDEVKSVIRCGSTTGAV